MAKYDDDDDDMSVQKRPLSGLDGMYANTNIVVLVLFSFCCNGLCLLPFILSLVGVMTCTDEKAKANAKVSLIISGIAVILGVAGQVIRISVGGGGFDFK